MKATSKVLLASQGDDYFRPDDICAAPDGSLYVADWYDGGVGGHAYNNPNQGRIFRLVAKNRPTPAAIKPGPYDNVPDALSALGSPNLATQFLARERLLESPEASVPALVALVDDAQSTDDPNVRARALWMLDRIGGDGRTTVLAQLGSPDSSMRALAVRILRRHGAEYADRILALQGDRSPEVAREVLLAIAGLKTPAARDALVEIASRYNGSDRYFLEAINIAAGSRKKELYDSLTKRGGLDVHRADLMQALDPDRTQQHLVRQLASADTEPADQSRSRRATGNERRSGHRPSVRQALGRSQRQPRSPPLRV